MLSRTTTDDIVKRSKTVGWVRRLVPRRIIALERHSPARYVRGRQVNTAYLDYLKAARDKWTPGTEHGSELARGIAGDLEQRGVARTSAAALADGPYEEPLERIQRLFAATGNVVCVRNAMWHYPRSAEAIANDPPQYAFVKQEILAGEKPLAELLCSPGFTAPVEAWLGSAVRLVSLYAYRCFAARARPARNMAWHHDNQPPHCVKLMIYLEEVPERAGALEYLLGSNRDASPVPGFGIAPLKDREALERYEHKSFTGKKFDAIYFDNNGWHRGGQVRRGRRTVVVAAYRPSKIPAREHLARFGYGGYLQEDTWGPDPEQAWW